MIERDATKDSLFPAENFTIEANGESQEFHIIQLHTAMKEYMTKANASHETNLRKLYEETIFQPVAQACFGQGEYMGIIQGIRENPPTQNVSSTNYPLMQKIMFGGDELPRGFGYSEGYRIAQAFLDAHPALDVEQWSAASPAEIYQLQK
ncbi:DUF2268 domain-containing putative Zn-dependent protease [Brevibacillus reuszeri]|uniref:DUF2268 domain-containing putative Zn-dependent protease n=1 Tax=Brevibacillus reuszeri TaxID=54915 RepID=UPI0028A00640|nr:DUF2268 domain-containing putative Zn-dependent protease [Brevibacillus reuszeri]